MKRKLDWSKLPSNLAYLAAPAEKYGRYQFEDKIFRFLCKMTEDDKHELTELLRRDDVAEIDAWLDEYPITKHPEANLVYFLQHLLGLGCDAGFFGPRESIPESWNTVENHIKELGRFGSYRLASGRAYAARFLADFGDKARSAIPHLRRALEDEDLRVRIWAHYALAVIEGRYGEHHAAIRKIFSKHNTKDNLGCYDDVGGEADAALEKLGEIKGMKRGHSTSSNLRLQKARRRKRK